jgi:hypothetical protein
MEKTRLFNPKPLVAPECYAQATKKRTLTNKINYKMTLLEFKRDFYCKVEITQNDNTLEIFSSAIRRSDNAIIDSIRTEMNIQDTSDWIINSHSSISTNNWTWPLMIDKAKRGHIDHFAIRAPIENFYPLNPTSVHSIEDLYTK